MYEEFFKLIASDAVADRFGVRYYQPNQTPGKYSFSERKTQEGYEAVKFSDRTVKIKD